MIYINITNNFIQSSIFKGNNPSNPYYKPPVNNLSGLIIIPCKCMKYPCQLLINFFTYYFKYFIERFPGMNNNRQVIFLRPAKLPTKNIFLLLLKRFIP